MIKSAVLLLAFTLAVHACNDVKTTNGQATTAENAEVYNVDTSAYYFPKKAFRDYNDSTKGNSFKLDWYSGMLRALKEPVLFTEAGEGEVYRFTCLRTFHAPFAIRVIHKTGDITMLVLKISDGAGGYTSKNLVRNETKALSEADWARLTAALNSTAFWNMPTEKPDFGCDGSEWIVEGRKNGEYHVVARWSPRKGDFYGLGKKMIELSGARITPLY
ncbi:hypothetical protein [Hymenobacter negativus]|uniref:Lipoprotein n=1 Tax=Hymenobacter negativus TaxID=2795026 RepID=A0ABS3QAV8_9BACT|nr:hypothetical protein [Hymenobacter negativus]MBO2008093.1 hypothetical protein [Hymenobacter negativus]